MEHSPNVGHTDKFVTNKQTDMVQCWDDSKQERYIEFERICFDSRTKETRYNCTTYIGYHASKTKCIFSDNYFRNETIVVTRTNRANPIRHGDVLGVAPPGIPFSQVFIALKNSGPSG